MSEFKVIETQEEFDQRISERLKREREKYDSTISELKQENEKLQIELGESKKAVEEAGAGSEGLNKQIEELTGKIGQYELAQLKTSIALKNGIPYDLADRLTGADEAAISEDAKRLAGYIAKKEPIAPLKSTEPTKVDPKEAALLQMTNSLTKKGE